jgi:hypothetical protein
MAKIADLPSQEYLKECFEYDEETGELIWKERPLSHFSCEASMKCTNTMKVGSVAGVSSSGYSKIKIAGDSYQVHTLVWKYHTGLNPVGQIDHINGDSLDNKFKNLRDVTRSENQHNRRIPSNNKSGYKGVRKTKYGTFHAFYNIKGHDVNLGSFATKEEAIAARKEAELKDWGDLEPKLRPINDFNLTLDYLKECVKYEDGHLIWLVRPLHHFKSIKGANSWNAKYPNTILSAKNQAGYVITTINAKMFRVHRLIYWLCTGIEIPDNMLIDHINNVRDDNRIENLRVCTKSENAQNKKMNITNVRKGCFLDRTRGNKWRAEIQSNGKVYHLGRFETELEAHQAYCKAATELHKEYANFGN